MSNTEKLIKKLNENKELKKLKEQQTNKNDTVVRVQQIKKALITLATDLLVNKKIKASLFKNMLSLTFTNIKENELNDYYNKLKGVQKDVKKATELQGPTKIKKVTLKDFKKETNNKKEVLNNNKEVLNNNNLVPYKGVVNGDNIYFHFYQPITESYLYKVSEEFLKIKKYKLEVIKIIYQLKRQNTQERKHLFMLLMVI